MGSVKKVDYRVMSDLKCSNKGCNKRIKQNVVNRKGFRKDLVCYKCYKKAEFQRRNKR